MKKHLFVPGGNPTLLIDNQEGAIDRNQYAEVAKKHLSKNVEQVGFLEKGSKGALRLQMMGGEFCVNALRSAALFHHQLYHDTNVILESSGAEKPIECTIEHWVSVRIPAKYSVKKFDDISLIHLPGISHFVIEKSSWNIAKMKKLFTELLKKHTKLLADIPAIGLITLLQDRSIRPLVYVRDTDSTIFETACGSGTLAAFIAMKGKNGYIKQPSGYTFIVSKEGDHFVLKSEVKVDCKTL